MKWRTALNLGRVSNLPTVWSNILLGFGLALPVSGINVETHLVFLSSLLFVLLLCASLIYIAGMYLNDAMDAQWDKDNNKQRPIPLGEVSVITVYRYGWSMLVIALSLIFLLDFSYLHNYWFSVSAIVLVISVIAYDRLHKKFKPSPWLMGLCRFMLYIFAALAIQGLSENIALAALCLMSYVVGLTYIAQTEHLNKAESWWPIVLFFMPLFYFIYQLNFDFVLALYLLPLFAWIIYHFRFLVPGVMRNVPLSIGRFIAGISLIDATILVINQMFVLAGIALFCFFATLAFQRKIAGT